MSAVLLLLSVLLSGCFATEYGWLPHKEYTFSVQGGNVVGLPQLRPQYAGFSFHGELRVQSHSPRVLLVKIVNMSYTKKHEDMPAGWWAGLYSAPKNTTKTLPITTSTVVVKMNKALSPELVMQEGLDDWQVNFIKGLISNLLTFIGDEAVSRNNSNKISYSPKKDVFSVFEDSVVGRCEVLYQVTPIPKHQQGMYKTHLCNHPDMWEVTKTRNYSNCQLLSEDHAHLPTKDCSPGGANCGHFWIRTSLTQMINCGERNNAVLLSSVTSSQINAQLHLQNSQSIINSNLILSLQSVTDLDNKFPVPEAKRTVKTLLYSYSTSPKDFSSRKCQEVSSGSEESDMTHKDQPETRDETNQVDSSSETQKDKKFNGKKEKLHSGPRNKRDYKKKYSSKYVSKSSDRFNENNDNEYSSEDRQHFDQNPNNFRTSSKKRRSNGQKKIEQQFSEETVEQPSEEMQLEDRWHISGKELKNDPPHQPFNMFTLAHQTSYELSCLNPKLRQIIADIASDLEDINIIPEKHTMDKMSIAVDICRSLPLDQLASTSEEVFEGQNSETNRMKSNERKVFRDVMTMCGTHPALQIIKGWIERNLVEGEEAAEIIASLPSHIFSPSKYLVQDFFNMVQMIAEGDDTQLKTTAMLALSNLVRDACVNPRSRQHHFSTIVKPVCDQGLASQVTGWLRGQLHSEPQMRRVLIQALGNIGSQEVISILRDIALDSKQSSYLQTTAVLAMRYPVLRREPEMAELLLFLYHNYSLPASTRIAAVALLVYSDPGLAMWQRLAISTWYEPSPAVANFLASSIRTMATSKDTIYSRLSKSASLVKPLARPSRVCVHQPYNLLTSWLSSDLEKIILEQLTWMTFYDYTNLYYRHSSRTSGYSRTNIEASFTAVNPDGLWNALRELIMITDPKNGPPGQGIHHTLANIQETLNIQPRSMPNLQGELHVKFNNMLERMLLVNKDTVKSWAKGGRRLVSKLQKEGLSVGYQKADMSSFHISTTTELGFPVQFSVRTPWIVRAKAELNVSGESLITSAAAMYSSQLLASVSVMSAWDNTAHTAGAYATNFLQLPPFHMTTRLNQSAETVVMKTDYIDQHRILYFSMQPFTSQRKLKVHQASLLSPDTNKIKLGASVQKPIPWMSRYLNSVYSSEKASYFNPLAFIKQARSVIGFPMIMPDLEPRSFETVMSPLQPLFMNFSMSIASKSMDLLELESPRDYTMELLNIVKKEKPGQSPPREPAELSRVVLNGKYSTTTPRPQYKLGFGSHKRTSDENIMGSFSEGVNVYPSTYDSATGDFNASLVDPFTNIVNGSSHYYLIEQILSKIHSGKAMVFNFNLRTSDPSTKLSAFLAHATTYSQRVSRFGFFVNVGDSKYLSTAVLEEPVDIATNIKLRVSQDLLYNTYMTYIHLYPGASDRVHVEAKMGVGRARLEELRSSHMLEACSQTSPDHFDSALESHCQQLQAQARELGFGNVTIYYNDNGKFVESRLRSYMNSVRVLHPWIEERPGEGVNTVTLRFDVDASTRFVNTHLTSPVSSVDVHALPLTSLPMSTFLEWAVQDRVHEDKCGLSTHRVRTFDGKKLPFDMEPKWYLVASDCSRQYGFSVMARASSNKSMAIEVNIDDQFVLSLEEGPKISVNYKPQPVNETQALLLLTDRLGHVLAHTVHTPDHSVHVKLPRHQLDIIYAGSSLLVQAGSGLQGRLCGLCGSYTHTGVERLLTAQGSPAESNAQFLSSYMLQDSSSEHH